MSRQTRYAWLAEGTALRATARGFSGDRAVIAPRRRAARHSTPHSPLSFSLEGKDVFLPGRWGQACIAATARAVDVTNASPRATPRAMTSG